MRQSGGPAQCERIQRNMDTGGNANILFLLYFRVSKSKISTELTSTYNYASLQTVAHINYCQIRPVDYMRVL